MRAKKSITEYESELAHLENSAMMAVVMMPHDEYRELINRINRVKRIIRKLQAEDYRKYQKAEKKYLINDALFIDAANKKYKEFKDAE